MRSTERPRMPTPAQNSAEKRTITSVRHIDGRDRDELTAEFGAEQVRQAYHQQMRDLVADVPLRTLREILTGTSDTPPVDGGQHREIVRAAPPAAPEPPAPSGAEALDNLYVALRAANAAGFAIDASPASIVRPGQADLFITTHAQAHDPTSEACTCLCCVRRRDQVRRWKERQPKRKKHKPIYGDPRWWPLADRNAKVRAKERGRALRKSGRQKGQHHGQLTAADLDVLYMLISYQNDHTGRCDPSMETLARKTGHCISTINLSISRLEAAGLIAVVRRRRKVRDGKGADWRSIATSNGYHIVDPLARYRQGIPKGSPSDSEFQQGVRAKNLLEGSSTAIPPNGPGPAPQPRSGVTLDG